MDSSGPWASYTYNGLPASQAPPHGSSGQRTVADLQAMGTPPAAAASQLLLAGMSPAAVAVAANSSFQLGNYDSSVFSTLFHHQKNAVAQHRSHQVMSQGGQMPLEQSSPWTPQSNSLGNPFGVLPHQASQKTNNPNKGENTFSAHIIPPFAHSGSNYSNGPTAPQLPFVPQKTAPKVPIFTPKTPPKHKNPPSAPEPVVRYNNNLSAVAAVAAATAVINNSKPSNIVVHRSFPPHLQPHCRSYPSPDSDYQQQRNTPDSVSSATYGDSDCHMSMERPSPNPSSPYYNMASPDSCVYSKPPNHFQEVDNKRGGPPPQQQQQQIPPQQQQQQQFSMKPSSHNSWEEKRAAATAAALAAAGRYNYSEAENNNSFPVSDQQHYQQAQSTINLADLHGGGDELLGGSDSEDFDRKRNRRNKRARKSDSPEKINRQLTLLQPVHAEDGYAASLSGFHSRVAFPPLPNHQPQAQHPQQNLHHHHLQQQQQAHQQQQHNYPPQAQQQPPQQSKDTRSSIDAELGFLEMAHSSRPTQPNNPRAMMGKKESPGFINSYIKFISGEQDPSASNSVHRTGRKSPPKPRGRPVQQPKVPAAPCPEPPAPLHPAHLQQQQHQHAYQIHHQQLDPAGHREELPEASGRGRKRSLPQNEGHAEQLEGLSIEGVDDVLSDLLRVADNNWVSEGNLSTCSSSSEEVDYSQEKFQPKLVLARISPATIRRYSQTNDDDSSSSHSINDEVEECQNDEIPSAPDDQVAMEFATTAPVESRVIAFPLPGTSGNSAFAEFISQSRAPIATLDAAKPELAGTVVEEKKSVEIVFKKIGSKSDPDASRWQHIKVLTLPRRASSDKSGAPPSVLSAVEKNVEILEVNQKEIDKVVIKEVPQNKQQSNDRKVQPTPNVLIGAKSASDPKKGFAESVANTPLALGNHCKKVILTANAICQDTNDLASEHGISIPYAVGELIVSKVPEPKDVQPSPTTHLQTGADILTGTKGTAVAKTMRALEELESIESNADLQSSTKDETEKMIAELTAVNPAAKDRKISLDDCDEVKALMSEYQISLKLTPQKQPPEPEQPDSNSIKPPIPVKPSLSLSEDVFTLPSKKKAIKKPPYKSAARVQLNKEAEALGQQELAQKDGPKWTKGSIEDELRHFNFGSLDTSKITAVPKVYPKFQQEGGLELSLPKAKPSPLSHRRASSTESRMQNQEQFKALPYKRKLWPTDGEAKAPKKGSAGQAEKKNKVEQTSSRTIIKNEDKKPVPEEDLIPELPIEVVRNNYRTTTFIEHVSHMNGGYPELYRIDGDDYMQKYEPYLDSGLLLYKSVPTYSFWAHTRYREFKVVEVDFFKRTKAFTIVRVIHARTPRKCTITAKKKSMYATDDKVDVFRTFVQALLSQSIDCGFLQAVIEDKDEYFTVPIDEIDGINDSKVKKMQNVYQFPQRIVDIVNCWPQFVSLPLNVCNLCECCKKVNAFYLLEASGTAYCKKTLCSLDLDLFALKEKEFIACQLCSQKVNSLSKVIHIKYNCYKLCVKELDKVKTDKINRLIKIVHSPWFETLFKSLQDLWAMVDCME